MTELPVVPEGVAEIDLVGVRRGAFGAAGSGDTSGFGGLVTPIVMPGASLPPFGGWFDEVAEELALSLLDAGVSGAIEKIVIDRGEMTFYVKPEHLIAFMAECRDEPAPVLVVFISPRKLVGNFTSFTACCQLPITVEFGLK